MASKAETCAGKANMNGKLHCVMVATDGGLASTVFGPLELLDFCARIQLAMPELKASHISAELLTPDGAPFNCVTGYTHHVSGGLKELPRGTVILLPGFGLPLPTQVAGLLARHTGLAEWLRRQHGNGCSIAAWCTGAFLLAEQGLLVSRRATIHPVYREEFTTRYPHVQLDLDATLVEDGSIWCLGGTACGMDTVLRIIELHVGKELARLCSKMVGLETRRPSELRYEERAPTIYSDALVRRAVGWIRRNLQREISIEEVLAHVPTSRRNLSRRFRAETGETLQAFIQRLRVDRAKLLLETTDDSIESIIGQVGYRDPSAFARQFKRSTQMSPLQYRRRFGLTN